MPQTERKQKQKQLSKNLPSFYSLCFVSPSISPFSRALLVSLIFAFCLPLFSFFFLQRKGLIAPEKEKAEQKASILKANLGEIEFRIFLSFFITFSFKFQGRSDAVSICQPTRLLFHFFFPFLYVSWRLTAAQICISDLYVKFIVSPVTSAMSGQPKGKGEKKTEKGKMVCLYVCVCIYVYMWMCVMGGGVGHGVIFLPP